MEKGNARAFNQLGGYYAEGSMGSHKIGQRQLNHLKAGELMCAEAYHNLGNSYYSGERNIWLPMKKIGTVISSIRRSCDVALNSIIALYQ